MGYRQKIDILPFPDKKLWGSDKKWMGPDKKRKGPDKKPIFPRQNNDIPLDFVKILSI